MINMKSTKQQGIMVYFKKDASKIFETDNSQSGNEASTSRPTANVELDQTTKRAYALKLVATGRSKKRKGGFIRKCDKK